MSFLSAVVRLILKKTSLLLSVTLMFKCSDCAFPSGFSCAGLPFSDPDMMVVGCKIVDEAVDVLLALVGGIQISRPILTVLRVSESRALLYAVRD